MYLQNYSLGAVKILYARGWVDGALYLFGLTTGRVAGGSSNDYF